MNRNYLRGYRAERRAVADLKSLGFMAIRTAGSHSPFDVIAVNKSGVRFVQIKSCRKLYNSVLRRAMADLSKVGFDLPVGCRAEAWIWVVGRDFYKFKLVGRSPKRFLRVFE